MKNLLNKYQKGAILPTASVFSLVGMLVTISYMSYGLNKKINLDHRIANTKAKYNAESGLAITYQQLSSSEWETDYDSTTFQGEFAMPNNMGSYKKVKLYKSLNEKTKRIERNSQATGTAIVKNIWGDSKTIEYNAEMRFELESLSEYMYLSNHELAGGAPGIYGGGTAITPESRSQPCFGANDVLGNEMELAGHLQTMEPILICGTGALPTFQNLVYVTEADEDFVNSIYNTCGDAVGDPILPNCGTANSCNRGCVDNIFVNETGPDGQGWVKKPKVCFPLEGYFSTVGAASAQHTYDATEMLYLSKSGNETSATLKDTLIMTDIEFLENGGYHVKRWWYLMPPYLKSDILTCGTLLDGDNVTVDCPLHIADDGTITNYNNDG